MDHHTMATVLRGWKYDDVWGFPPDPPARATDKAVPARPKRRRLLSLRRWAHLGPAAGVTP